MTITSLTYTPPIRREAASRPLDYDLVETANEQFSAGDFLASAQTVFKHLFPSSAGPPPLPGAFQFSQGSSRVTVRIEDDICFLSVPMVRLPPATTGGGVAALRYVLSRINGSGQLAQARLRGDDIYMEYSEQLSALHPQKLIEVLRRISVEADRHDDWMESQFGVTPLERGAIEPLTPAELDRAAALWQQHWTDVEELLKEAQRKRSQFFLNEVTSFAIQRVRFALPIAGSVLPRLLEAAGTFNDSDADPRKRETTLTKFIKEMRALAPADLNRSLGHVDYAISPHAEGTPARFAGFFGPGNYMDTIERYRGSGQSMDAALPLVGSYYYLLATHTWPTEVSTAMKDGLAATSGKPWRDIASQLIDHARELHDQYGAAAESDDDDESDDDESDDDESDDAATQEEAQ